MSFLSFRVDRRIWNRNSEGGGRGTEIVSAGEDPSYDKDTTTAKNAHEQILEKFGNGEADILSEHR